MRSSIWCHCRQIFWSVFKETCQLQHFDMFMCLVVGVVQLHHRPFFAAPRGWFTFEPGSEGDMEQRDLCFSFPP